MTADNPFRSLPSVDRLLADERLYGLANGTGAVLTNLVRDTLDSARGAIAQGQAPPSYDELVESVLQRADSVFQPSLRSVINATGVIIHTNLGRAPLSTETLAAMESISHGYSNLEFDLVQGERGSRYTHLETLLSQLTGAEAAIAVNNNASALLLTLSALAQGREVIVSRGQAVEIGGGFRIPDVMRQSGARLVEVGTTNRTYRRDYEEAITSETAAILRVHTSNFRIVGFTETPSIEELALLAHEKTLLLLDDLGSGCLLDTGQFSLAEERTVQASLAAGADLATFSGDKLLGGPQAGIIVGRAELISDLRRHPLARALRMDKASIAGLAATLSHYLRGEAVEKIPVWRMVALPLPAIARRARRWAKAITAAGAPARVADGRSMVGGGSLPEESLPTKLVAIGGSDIDVVALAQRLQSGEPPVIARIEKGALLLDPRTVHPEEDRALVAAITKALSASAKSS